MPVALVAGCENLITTRASAVYNAIIDAEKPNWAIYYYDLQQNDFQLYNRIRNPVAAGFMNLPENQLNHCFIHCHGSYRINNNITTSVDLSIWDQGPHNMVGGYQSYMNWIGNHPAIERVTIAACNSGLVDANSPAQVIANNLDVQVRGSEEPLMGLNGVNINWQENNPVGWRIINPIGNNV